MSAKREEIEIWMKRHHVHITFLQETKMPTVHKEVRPGFTWYNVGTPETSVREAGSPFVTGVGFV
eukprot:186258-Prorocentrum_lima.AAC.1